MNDMRLGREDDHNGVGFKLIRIRRNLFVPVRITGTLNHLSIPLPFIFISFIYYYIFPSHFIIIFYATIYGTHVYLAMLR